MILKFRCLLVLNFVCMLGLLNLRCSSPSNDNELAIESAIYDVNMRLSVGDCNGAYLKLYPLFNSTNSNNAIRLSMSSVYGCMAGINLTEIINNLVKHSVSLNSGVFWNLLAQLFPSTQTPDDKRLASALYAIDAASSVLEAPFVLTANQINASTFNPGSTLYLDRSDDANASIFFLSMATMGILQNRYGNPLPNYHKGNPLPWIDATLTAGDGCAFASTLLDFSESLNFLSQKSNPPIKQAYQAISTLLSIGGGLNLVCAAGCTACAAAGGTADCTSCPTTLKDRNSCLGNRDDNNSCAAAALVNIVVNGTWAGPP